MGNLSTCQWLSLAMQNQNHDVKYSSSCFKSSTQMQEKSTSHLLSTWCFSILNRTPQTQKKHLYAWDIFSLAFCNWPAVTPSGGLMVAETKVPFHTQKKRTVGTSKGHKSSSFLDIGFFRCHVDISCHFTSFRKFATPSGHYPLHLHRAPLRHSH